MLPVANSPASEIFLENEEDAVYGVRLRRVTYNSGLTDSFLQWQTEKVRTLRAATPERLIKELVPEHGGIDATLLITFLGTYRTFMSVEELLARIRQRISDHCQLHSLTTISRSSSEDSVGSASPGRSGSPSTASSVEDSQEDAEEAMGAEDSELPRSQPVAFFDEDMVGTEELVRTVIGRSLSLSAFSSMAVGGRSPSLRGRPTVSQRIKIYSQMTEGIAKPRPVLRTRASTVESAVSHAMNDIAAGGSSCDSHTINMTPSRPPRDRESFEQHMRKGSDGTQRDSGNGTESQEESADHEHEPDNKVPVMRPSPNFRRKLPFSRGESTYSSERVANTDAPLLRGADQPDAVEKPHRWDEKAKRLSQRSRSFSPAASSLSVGSRDSLSSEPRQTGIRSSSSTSNEALSPPPGQERQHSMVAEEEEDLVVTSIDDVETASSLVVTDVDDVAAGSQLQVLNIDGASAHTTLEFVSPDLGVAVGSFNPIAMEAAFGGENNAEDDPLTVSDAEEGDMAASGDTEVALGAVAELEVLRPESRHGPDPKDIFKSVLSVLRVWLDQYPEDFRKPQIQMHLFGLLEECRIAPGPEFDDVYSLAELLSSERSPTLPSSPTSALSAGSTLATPGAGTDGFEEGGAPLMKKSSTLVSLHQRHRNTLTMKGALSPGVDVASMPRSYIDFLSIPAMKLAEQLTLIDANLFRAVVPYHCLSHFWSRRNSGKPGVETCASVAGTISQFNRVCMLMATSVLKGLQHRRVSAKDNKPAQRAKILEHWVDIAQCCRILKNFSSLRAIISSLQSTSVSRLSKTWSLVDKELMVLFKELCQMSSFSDNDQKTRAILMKEGTSKYSGFDHARTTKSPKSKLTNRYSDSNNGAGFVVQGVVPYLGTFLTDLTMVDSAHPNLTEEGFVNFQKRRKEFELLAQLMLFQKACKYVFENDTMIQTWMLQSEVISDDECYKRSLELEPEQTEPHRQSRPAVKSWKARFRRTLTISKTPSKDSQECAVISLNKNDSNHMPVPGVQNRLFRGSFRGDPRLNSPPVLSTTLDDDQLPSSSCSPSASTSSTRLEDLAPVSPSVTTMPSSHRTTTSSPSTDSVGSADAPKWDEWFKDAHLIRVRMESDDLKGAYKSFLLKNGDRARAVVERVLRKNMIDEKVDMYSLYQIVSQANNKEIRIPMDANVFYALNTSCDHFDFVLRHKDRQHATAGLKSSSSSVVSGKSKWTPLPD